MINVEKIKPTSLFTNYIYKAIPLAFDESMSYYETLCGLLYYLKDTVTPALNNNADAIVEVQELMTQLQNYVDNYFDNLDVQEEINNKLDEMVEDGTLTTLIGNYCYPLINEQNEKIEILETAVSTNATNLSNEITDRQNSDTTLQNSITAESNTRYNDDVDLQNQINNLASGSPLVASSTSEMTDTSKVYVNTTDGNWYYYDGDSWEIGGVYQATGVSESDPVIQEINDRLINYSKGMGKKDTPFLYSIDNATIAVTNTIETIVLTPQQNIYVACVLGCSTIHVNGGNLYSFFKTAPEIGTTNGTSRVSITQSDITISVPDGYNYIAVRSISQPNFSIPNSIQDTLLNTELFAKRLKQEGNLVEGYIANAGIESAGNIASLESRNVYYANVENFKKIQIANGESYAFYDVKPEIGIVGITARVILSGKTIVNVPEEAKYIGIRNNIDVSIYAEKGVLIVSQEGRGDYTTVTDAVANSQNGDTIYIMPGIYEDEEIEGWGKELHLIGIDKANTIIKNENDNYATPPLEIARGSVENLTFIAVTTGHTEGSQYSYAVHIEDSALYNGNLTFKNCRFEAQNGATVGMGLRGYSNVEFENCEFISTGYVAERGTSGYALYFHDTIDPEQVGTCNVSFKNCQLVGKHSAGVVTRIDSNGLSGSEVIVEWINTIMYNENYVSTYFSLHNNGGSTPAGWLGLKGYYNSPLSFNNNSNQMNYSA